MERRNELVAYTPECIVRFDGFIYIAVCFLFWSWPLDVTTWSHSHSPVGCTYVPLRLVRLTQWIRLHLIVALNWYFLAVARCWLWLTEMPRSTHPRSICIVDIAITFHRNLSLSLVTASHQADFVQTPPPPAAAARETVAGTGFRCVRHRPPSAPDAGTASSVCVVVAQRSCGNWAIASENGTTLGSAVRSELMTDALTITFNRLSDGPFQRTCGISELVIHWTRL